MEDNGVTNILEELRKDISVAIVEKFITLFKLFVVQKITDLNKLKITINANNNSLEPKEKLLKISVINDTLHKYETTHIIFTNMNNGKNDDNNKNEEKANVSS